MKSFRYIRRAKTLWLICLAVSIGPGLSSATDGQPILELGIVSWLQHQKMQLTAEVAVVKIQDHAIQPADLTVSIYQAAIFENLDEMNHVLVFLPGIDNLMEKEYTSAIIGAGERWGAEFHGFGVIPYRCTIHPEEHGSVTIVL